MRRQHAGTIAVQAAAVVKALGRRTVNTRRRVALLWTLVCASGLWVLSATTFSLRALSPFFWLSGWTENASMGGVLMLLAWLGLVAASHVLQNLLFTVHRHTDVHIVGQVAQYLHARYLVWVAGCAVLAPLSILLLLSRLDRPASLPFLTGADAKHHPRCVNARFLYLLIHGALIGAIYAATYVTSERFTLAFPLLPQPRPQLVRARLGSAAWYALSRALVWGRYIALTTILLWSLSAPSVSEAPDAPTDTAPPPEILRKTLPWLSIPICVRTTHMYVDPGLACDLLLATTVVLLAWEVTRVISSVLLTHTLAFDVPVPGSPSATLVEALVATDAPLIRHLAYRDLVTVAQFCPGRRSHLYTDDNGNAWKSLVARVCDLLDGLSCQLHRATVTQSADINIQRVQAFSLSTLVYYWFQRHWNPFAQPTAGAQASARYGAIADYNAWVATREPPLESTASLWGVIRGSLRRRPATAALLDVAPTAFYKHVFDDLTMQMWAVQAVSELAARSYDEDVHGVVQRTLPRILSSLLALLLETEKHLATPSLLNPPLGGSLQGHQLLREQAYALVSVLNSGIYRIVVVFYQHLGAFVFPKEYAPKLQRFVDFVE